MKYAKLINGKIEFAPKNEIVCGIEIEPSKSIMLKRGYKQLLDIKPTYDKETQYLRQSSGGTRKALRQTENQPKSQD